MRQEYRWVQLDHLRLRSSSPPFQDAIAHHSTTRCVFACLCSPFGVGCTLSGVTGPTIPAGCYVARTRVFQFPASCLGISSPGTVCLHLRWAVLGASSVAGAYACLRSLGGYLCVCASDSHEPPFPGDQVTTGAPNRMLPNIFRI
jgi:hypothetical protein